MRRCATRHEPVTHGGAFLLGLALYGLTASLLMAPIVFAGLAAELGLGLHVPRAVPLLVLGCTMLLGLALGGYSAPLMPDGRQILAYLAGLSLLPLLALSACILSNNPGWPVFWLPAIPVAVGLAAARLWFGIPIYGTHHRCTCGYDLRGNTSGYCPECGSMLTPLRRK